MIRGGAQDAAVGDRAVGGGHLHRRDGQALADRHVAHARARVVLAVEQQARLLARQVDARGLAEAEAPDPAIEVVGAEPLPDRHGADVGGLLEDLGRGQGHVAARVRLADLAVGHGDRRREVERRVRPHLALLERGGHGERLERRAGLVGHARRPVHHRVVRRVEQAVGVDARPVGERQHGPVLRVHHERGGALGLPRLPDPGERLLGLVLDVGVERELDVRPPPRAGDVAQLDRVAQRVLDELALAVGAAQPAVELVLEPRQALPVGPDVAEQLRGHPRARVVALELRQEVDALDLEPARPVGAAGGHVAREVDEAGVPAGELAQQLVLGHLERAGRAPRPPSRDP